MAQANLVSGRGHVREVSCGMKCFGYEKTSSIIRIIQLTVPGGIKYRSEWAKRIFETVS